MQTCKTLVTTAARSGLPGSTLSSTARCWCRESEGAFSAEVEAHVPQVQLGPGAVLDLTRIWFAVPGILPDAPEVVIGRGQARLPQGGIAQRLGVPVHEAPVMDRTVPLEPEHPHPGSASVLPAQIARPVRRGAPARPVGGAGARSG